MKQEEQLIKAFKRLIHVLSTGKKTPFVYGKTTLYRAEVHILEIIGKSAGITATDIVNDMDITKGAISQIISKLLTKGLVDRSFQEDNMKNQELYLTDLGRQVLNYHEEHEQELKRKVMAELKKCRAEDIEKFTAIVNLITDFSKK